ncbi:uncharacterized protein LOC135825237 [Sycon ciliatum]|uniref:uncharacterized protein LOC135825237 n=1 Tax=Sycon ciliatum TaxID=27933 RepID=UPI0031F6C75D
MDAHESGVNGLESVQFDVWQDILLPMLSIQDIFQLCAVSKSMQRLLLNEYTFRRLCLHRYQLSPYLDVPYIRIAKSLHIADQAASMFDSGDESSLDYLDCLTFNCRRRSTVQLLCLALKPFPIFSRIPSCKKSGLLYPPFKNATLFPEDASEDLPTISPIMIRESCTTVDPLKPFEGRMYLIGDIANLLFETCGSLEHYQEAIINCLEEDMSLLLECLPYVHQSWRLVELAKGLLSLAKSDAKICSYLGLDGPDLGAYLSSVWTYNPYLCWCLLENQDDILDYFDPVILTNQWVKKVANLGSNHSVVNLLIIGRLRTSQVDDYFTAIIEHEDLVTHWPQPRRPNRHDLYLGLGSFLLSSSQGQQYRKEWTKEELLDAMMRYGYELTVKELL